MRVPQRPQGYTLSFFCQSRGRHPICSRDWSSDVCSSDLKEKITAKNSPAEDQGERSVRAECGLPEQRQNDSSEDEKRAAYKKLGGQHSRKELGRCLQQIGRASCRERV